MKKYIFLFLSAALFSSCFPGEGEEGPQPETEADIIKYITDNNLNASRTRSGLYYVINNEGTGNVPDLSSEVRVNLKGYLLDGTVFRENRAEGVAVSLETQIPGLAEGIQLFKEGGEGILLIPSELGFNDGTVLVIEVKLIEVIDNEADILKYIDDNNLDATKTDSGLYYVINKEGTGKKPAVNSIVKVAYKGYFLDGTVFDESNTDGISFNLNQVIEGWKEGIPFFKEGGEGILLIPNNLGYGLQERPPIPGGSVLIFDIKLISVN